mmetsp:Transcript_17236/g.47791  ORF Transcript_17236/g.47791 Transcript_17236/m.47791 type:complete len:1478 (-) Transcript_17236:809-5242(-)
MDELTHHLEPAVGSSDLLGIGVKRADFEYGYMLRARAPGAPAKSTSGGPAPLPLPARPTTGRQQQHHHHHHHQQQQASRIYVNPEVYAMIQKAAKELDQFQTALDHELDAHIPASERLKTLQSLGLGNLHKKGGAFSQLSQVDTRPGQPRPPELQIPPDSGIESPQGNAGAVNVGFSRPLGELLSRLDEEAKQKQRKDEEQAVEAEDKGVAGASESEAENKESSNGGSEEALDHKEEAGEEESLSASDSEHTQSPRSVQRSYTKQKSNKSVTHSEGGGQGSENADQDLDLSIGSEGMESDNGGLEGEKAEGASIGSRRSSKSPSPYGKRADSEEDEDEASSSEASEDEDVPPYSMGKSSTFTSQVVDRRKMSQDLGSEDSAQEDEDESEEHRAARLQAEQEIQAELRMVHSRLTFQVPGEEEEEEQEDEQAPPAEAVKPHKRRHKKRSDEDKKVENTAEAEMAARRRALMLEEDDEEEDPSPAKEAAGSGNYALDDGAKEGSRKARMSQAGDATRAKRSLARASESRRSIAGTGGRSMRPNATFKNSFSPRSPRRASMMGSAASPRTSIKGNTVFTGELNRPNSDDEGTEEQGAPGRKRSMFGNLRRSTAGQGARGTAGGVSIRDRSTGSVSIKDIPAGGVSIRDRTQLSSPGDPVNPAGRRLSTAGVELLGSVNQDLEALITAQANAANAQREARMSSTGCQDEAGGKKKSHKKPWTNITYIPPSLKGVCDLIDTAPCAEHVDPFTREDYAPPLSEPSLILPPKPRPPPSARRIRQLEEQREREEQEQQQREQRRHMQQLQAELGDVYTEIEDVLLMGEDNTKSIPVQVLTHKRKSDHAIVGRAMRVQWSKLAKGLDDDDPSASQLQDIPLPLDGLPTPPPPSRQLQVVGTNAMKRKQGIEDTASRAFQTWQQPQAQTGVPEAPKLAPAMPKAWKQQGSRHNTVIPRPPCDLAILPSKHATADPPHAGPLPSGMPKGVPGPLQAASQPLSPRSQALQPHPSIQSLLDPGVEAALLPAGPPSYHGVTSGVLSPLPVSHPFFHSIAALGEFKPETQERPSAHQSPIKPLTLQLPPDLQPPPSKSSPTAPKPLRSHPRTKPEKTLSPARSLDPPRDPNPPPRRASMDAKSRAPQDDVFLTQSPDMSEVLAGTALAGSHEALQAVAAAGYSAWKERAQVEEAAALGQQQQQGLGQKWHGVKEQGQSQHQQQQDLGPSQQHRHQRHLSDNSVQQSLAYMSSFLQPTVEHSSKWTQPVPPENLPNAPHSSFPNATPLMPAFSPSKTAKQQAPASTAHSSYPPNLKTGEGHSCFAPISPASKEAKVSLDPPSFQPHAMPHFLRKLIALQHPQKKAEQKHSHLPDDPFLPRLKEASLPEPERSCQSDSSPWLQRSFKDTYCASQGLSHVPHLPEIHKSHSSEHVCRLDDTGFEHSSGDVQARASKPGPAGRSSALQHYHQHYYNRRERVPLAARARGEVFYPGE